MPDMLKIPAGSRISVPCSGNRSGSCRRCSVARPHPCPSPELGRGDSDPAWQAVNRRRLGFAWLINSVHAEWDRSTQPTDYRLEIVPHVGHDGHAPYLDLNPMIHAVGVVGVALGWRNATAGGNSDYNYVLKELKPRLKCQLILRNNN